MREEFWILKAANNLSPSAEKVEFEKTSESDCDEAAEELQKIWKFVWCLERKGRDVELKKIY